MINNVSQTHRLDLGKSGIEKGALVLDELDSASPQELSKIYNAIFFKKKKGNKKLENERDDVNDEDN